jgi:ribosomal 50S subunit-associated protein YjgA (DUF615 family)
MDTQARKLQFIQDFLRYADDSIVEKFEELLSKIRKNGFEKETTQMSVEQYEARILQAFEDAKENRYKSTEDLRSEIASWQ